MKKQLRLVLFVLIIATLALMTVIGVSAATDGADVREDGHYYEVVSSADGATPKYYTTLASAVAAIDADGYTVTVLGDVTEPAATLDKAFAYTISGGQTGATITFSSKTSDALIVATAGKVTLDNVTLACNAGVSSKYVVHINGATEFVLNNVVTSVAVTDNTVYAAKATAFTVSGAKTDISGAAKGFYDPKANVATTVTITDGKITSGGYIFRLSGKLTASLSGGELIGGAGSDMFLTQRYGANSELNISGATVMPAEGKSVFNLQVAVAITLGADAKIWANDAAIFAQMNKNGTVAVSGAQIHLKGEDGMLYEAGEATGTVTTNSGKIYMHTGAQLPAEALDTVFDWTKLTFVVAGFNGQLELTEAGTYNFASPADVVALIADAAKKPFESARFEGVTVEVDIDVSSWIPLIINGEGVIVNVTAGEYRLADGDSFATLIAGTLNISGGSFYATNGDAFVPVQGGSLSISGGTFYGTAGVVLLPVTGGSLSISGGTFTDVTHAINATDGAITISGGTFANVTHAIDATGGTIAVTGGSFTLKGFADTATDAAFLKYTGEAAVVIGAADGTTGPSIVLGASAGVTAFAKGIVITKDAVELTVNAGSFVTDGSANVIFDLPAAIAKLEIKGGSYTITGAGAVLLSSALDRENCGVTITGGTVTVANGAIIPTFNYIESSALSLVLEGMVQYRITKAGNYTFSRPVEIYDLIKAYFTTSVTISGEEAEWIPLVLDCADAVLTVTGGEYEYDGDFFVVNAGTLNIAGGKFNAMGDNLIVVNGGKLNVTGGEFENILYGVFINGGEVVISGGNFTAGRPSAQLVSVRGNAKLTITPNADGGAEPRLYLPKDEKSFAVRVTSAANGAEINISGGYFGNAGANGTYYTLSLEAAAIANITGGTFVGGHSGCAIQVKGTGAVLNLSGTATMYGFKNIIASGDVTVNVSGGFFNPLTNLSTGKITQPKCRLIEMTSEVAKVNVSGGTFNNFLQAFNFTAPATLTVTGGTFIPRTSHADTEVDAFINCTANAVGAVIVVGDEETGAGPVVNLGYVASGNTKYPDSSYTKLFNFLCNNVDLTVYAGEFIAQDAKNEMFVLNKPKALNILGGSFSITGSGTQLISDELLANSKTTLQNITVIVRDGAAFPDISTEVNKTITLVLAGDVKEIEVRTGTHVVRNLDDIYGIIRSIYKEVTIEKPAASGWIPLHINGKDASVTLENVIDNYSGEYFVRVTEGTLIINGGEFSALAGEKLFDVCPYPVVDGEQHVTLTFNGGYYSAVGVSSYILAIAEGVNTSGISMTGANLYVAEFGSAPVQVDFTMTDNTIEVHGLSGITLKQAGEYTIASASDLTALVESALLDSFESEKLKVEIYTWVPIHLDNKDAILNVTGGQYAGGAPFFFKLSAGTINITGGKFNNSVGDMIQLVGTGTLNINLPTYDTSHGFTSQGSMIYVAGAANSSITIQGGHFVSRLPDTTNDETKAFIFFDDSERSSSGTTLVIEDGHFEATRILRVDATGVEVTIKNGEFVSDYFIDNDLVTERAENANMFAVHGQYSKLSILDGTFDNKDGNYLFVLEYFAEAVIDGGQFNGSGWAQLSDFATLTVNANEDPEKTPVFTDTGALALGDYIIVDKNATLLLNAGTFTAGTSEYFVLTAKRGTVTVNGGTYKGSLFNVCDACVMLLNDGTFTATGKEGALFRFEGAVTATNLTLSKELNFTVEKNAAIIDTTLGAESVKALLANANITVTDYTKIAAYLPSSITFATEADLVSFVKSYLPEGKVTFLLENPVCGVVVYGESNIFVTGGNWTFEGDHLFKFMAPASLTITDGNFSITNGGLIYAANGAVVITIGDKDNAELCPTVSITNGLKALLYVEGAGTAITIYNGNFTANDFPDFNMFTFYTQSATVEILGGTFTVTKGSHYDEETGTQLLHDTSLFYLERYYVDGVAKTDGKVDITIRGGTFSGPRIVFYYYSGGELNIYDGNFVSNAYAYNNTYMFWSRHKNNQFNIYGGTFTGNKYSAGFFYANSASGSGSNVRKFTIVGGTFSKGLHWIVVTSPTNVTIDRTETTVPVFNGLSDGTTSKYGSKVTAHGIYFTNKAVGSIVEIKAGNFRLPSGLLYTMVLFQGGDLTVYDGVVMEGPHYIFQGGGNMKATITIKGGTFICNDAGYIFSLEVKTRQTDRTALAESKFVIEGGTFKANQTATVFYVASLEELYSITVKGGTFSSAESRLAFVTLDNVSSFVIEGGSFTTQAVRMFHIDSCVTPFLIKDGTFTLQDRESSNKADDGLLYLVGKNPAAIKVSGGTFIDQRLGSNQTFVKMNPNGEFDFAGEFKIYVLEEKKNFYYDSNDDANSVPFMPWKETYQGQEYFVCFGYYNEFAPTITSAPVIRPVLGQEGLTFMANVSPEVQEYLATLGTVSYGTIIFPTKYFENGWKNGTDFLTELKAYASANGLSESTVYVMIPAVNGLVTEEDGSLTIRASLVNIKEKNYTLDISGIAYAKVTAEDGTETYYYASHVSAGVSNNIRAAAKYALSDVNAKAVTEGNRVYCYASIMRKNQFSRYDSAVQYSMRKYLVASDRKPK